MRCTLSSLTNRVINIRLVALIVNRINRQNKTVYRTGIVTKLLIVILTMAERQSK